MDIILSQGGTQLVLPVLPDSYQIQTSRGNESVTVNAIGEVTLLGLQKLDTVSWQCFFPAREESYTRAGISSPSEYVALMLAMQAGGPIDLHLLDVLAMHATIETFSYGEADGTGDIEYSVNLKKYIYINEDGIVNKAILQGQGRSAPETPRDGVTYTVKEGDSLFTIARKQLDTTDWSELYQINREIIGSNPALITPGMLLTLPSA